MGVQRGITVIDDGKGIERIETKGVAFQFGQCVPASRMARGPNRHQTIGHCAIKRDARDGNINWSNRGLAAATKLSAPE